MGFILGFVFGLYCKQEFDYFFNTLIFFRLIVWS